MKKFMQIALALVVSVMFVGNVDAAVNQKLVDFAKNKVTAADMTRLERFLGQNEVTDEQADQIIAKANEIQKILDNAKVTDYSKLTKAQKNQVLSIAQDAAKIVGAKLTYDNRNKVVEVTDAKGNVYDIPADSYLRTTGEDNMIYVVSASGVLLVGAAVVLYRKKFNA